MLILMCGLPGSGKSIDAKKIKKHINCILFRTDEIREKLFRKGSIDEILKAENPGEYDLQVFSESPQKIPDKWQEFIWKQNDMVYNELTDRIEKTLQSGKNVLIDATSYQKKFREMIYRIAKISGSEVYVVECVAPEDVIKGRLEGRMKKKTKTHAKKMEVYYKMKSRYESPEDDGVPLIRIDTHKHESKLIKGNPDDENIKMIIEALDS